MKTLSAFVFVLLLSACGSPNEANREPGLEELRGQWVFINYWAQWCKPCIEEIPELNALGEKFANVTVLGVNYDGANGEDLAAQIAALDIRFQVLPEDPSAQLGIPRPVVLPTTLVLDPTGKLATTLLGPQTLESLAAILELEKSTNSPD